MAKGKSNAQLSLPLLVVIVFVVILLFASGSSGSSVDNFRDVTARPCEHSEKSCTTCSGGYEGLCVDNECAPGGGWNDSISRDCHPGHKFDAAPTADGQRRVFKMPNYYGWGPSQRFSYGEPYYAREDKY